MTDTDRRKLELWPELINIIFDLLSKGNHNQEWGIKVNVQAKDILAKAASIGKETK